MRVLALFILLISILLGGNVNSLSIRVDSHANASGTDKNKAQQVTITTTACHFTTLDNTRLSADDKCILVEEAKEDEEHASAVKKTSTGANFYTTSSYQPFLSGVPDTQKALQLSWYQVSHRYLVHRSLRI